MHVTSTQKSSVMIAVYAWSAGTAMSDLNPEYLEVVSTLKYVRLLKGYTLEHVEVVTNGEFTKEAVGSYERNSRNITLRKLLKLCDVYGVSIDTIIRSSMYGDPIHVVRRRNYELRTTA
jgi:transcriptional regulator with XRE-family HTH domain